MKFTTITLFTLIAATVAVPNNIARKERQCSNKIKRVDKAVRFLEVWEGHEEDDPMYQRACLPSDYCSCEGIVPGHFCGSGFDGCEKNVVYMCWGDLDSCQCGYSESCEECGDPHQCEVGVSITSSFEIL
ncbi:hypothetical protein CspeluHIS016_0403040 [Cutaneotrichosporon spelunceum]|uniref:Uncharacterized protein n=1 Tax=Cutaneotrichosporon spelunceum TaxID=1672016 RepID=A0AAD3YBW6_9TREE|nr:hypothetical protein CspeluHIS016_0403040 [Cutaneotrichosporon spelunceum]